MDNAGVDLATYAGISFAVVAVIGAGKRLFKEWVSGKEPMMALVVTMILGILAKVGGLFPGTDLKSWVVHVVLLLVTAGGAGVMHDKITNVFAGKDK